MSSQSGQQVTSSSNQQAASSSSKQASDSSEIKPVIFLCYFYQKNGCKNLAPESAEIDGASCKKCQDHWEDYFKRGNGDNIFGLWVPDKKNPGTYLWFPGLDSSPAIAGEMPGQYPPIPVYK